MINAEEVSIEEIVEVSNEATKEVVCLKTDDIKVRFFSIITIRL